MSFEQEFTEKVGGYLAKLTDKLQPILKQLIEHDYPQEVVTLAFEVFVDRFSSQFPVRVFFIDKDNLSNKKPYNNLLSEFNVFLYNRFMNNSCGI